jgi:hypothetical protein
LPLLAELAEAELLAVDAPAVDAPDVVVDELDDDEHAAVTPSSNAAAAPAAGTDTDRFIPAPSRESSGFGCRSRMAQGAPLMSARGLAYLHPIDRHVQLMATSRKHMA